MWPPNGRRSNRSYSNGSILGDPDVPSLTINRTSTNGQILGADYFHINFLPQANSGETPFGGNEGNTIGNPTIESEAAIEQFGVSFIRFPAGQANEMFASSGVITNGDIPDFLRNFLEYSQQNAIKVNLVVPVESLEPFGGPDQGTILSDLEDLAAIVARDFPGVVVGYELGNEYWGERTPGDESREVEYGHAAAHAAIAICNGAAEYGSDPVIILQASGNLGGAYENSLSCANQAIQNAFSSVDGALDLVDGVVRNFYWRDGDEGAFDNSTGIFSEDRGLFENINGYGDATWDAWADRDLTTYVGEYNITNRLSYGPDGIDLGIHGASMLLEHFTNMIQADVDVAFAWPFLHSTRNAFILRHEGIETTEILGMEITTNTTRSAMFDLLRQTVVGDELVETEWVSDTAIEVTAFQDVHFANSESSTSQYSRTIFLSSRTDEAELVDIDLSEFASGYSQMSAISIYYEASDDHHRDAVLTEIPNLDFDRDGRFSILLNPYEVVQLVFRFGFDLLSDGTIAFTPGSDEFTGSDSQEQFQMGDGDDTLRALGGDDWVDGGNGNDLIYGGSGNDTILAGGSSDTVFGGVGDDVIHGDWGRDFIYGEDGDDTIYSGTMNDVVHGGFGSDLISAGSGNDRVWGDNGSDSLYGYEGDDFLDGGIGNDFLYGGFGNDTLNGGNNSDRIFGGDGEDFIMGGNGNDCVFGMNGDDTMRGGTGDDLIRAGTGNDDLQGGSGEDSLFGGSGFDRLAGDQGDDVLYGNFNADLFIFGLDHGNDYIMDFEWSNPAERIDLSALGSFLNFDDMLENAFEIDGGTLIVTGFDSSIFLHDVGVADLEYSSFLF